MIIVSIYLNDIRYDTEKNINAIFKCVYNCIFLVFSLNFLNFTYIFFFFFYIYPFFWHY